MPSTRLCTAQTLTPFPGLSSRSSWAFAIGGKRAHNKTSTRLQGTQRSDWNMWAQQAATKSVLPAYAAGEEGCGVCKAGAGASEGPSVVHEMHMAISCTYFR